MLQINSEIVKCVLSSLFYNIVMVLNPHLNTVKIKSGGCISQVISRSEVPVNTRLYVHIGPWGFLAHKTRAKKVVPVSLSNAN